MKFLGTREHVLRARSLLALVVLGLADSASPRPVLSSRVLTPVGPWEPASLRLSTSASALRLWQGAGRGRDEGQRKACTPYCVSIQGTGRRLLSGLAEPCYI